MIMDYYRRSNQVKANFKMCANFNLSNLHSTFCNSFYDIELYSFKKSLYKMYTLHGVNVFELYFVFLIPLIIILFII